MIGEILKSRQTIGVLFKSISLFGNSLIPKLSSICPHAKEDADDYVEIDFDGL
jgi:hypothetical protein